MPGNQGGCSLPALVDCSLLEWLVPPVGRESSRVDVDYLAGATDDGQARRERSRDPALILHRQ
jgi:hypothetical protein